MLDELSKRVVDLERDCFALAARQCTDPYSDERGNAHCRRVETLERELDAARNEVRSILEEYEGEYKGGRREKFYQAHIRGAWRQCAHRIGRVLGMTECFPAEEL